MTDPIELELLCNWLLQYGSLALFSLLALGIIALPIPEETLLVITGVLLFNEKLSPQSTLLAAWGGSICGITVSYLMGRTAGLYLLQKYGRWFGLTEERLEKMHQWFKRFGKWTLFIGYFIPGVRHFTGLTAGISHLEFKPFVLFAYSGAICWVSLFLSIGYFFGSYWLYLFEKVEINVEGMLLFLLAIAIGWAIYFVKKRYALRKKLIDN